MILELQNLNFHFCAEFFSSTRRLPAAARRRTEVHRVRAVRQEQHRNRIKEPLKAYPKAKGSTNFNKLFKTNPITKRPKMNINKVLTKGYENIRPRSRGKNKPNQTQFKPNYKKAKNERN